MATVHQSAETTIVDALSGVTMIAITVTDALAIGTMEIGTTKAIATFAVVRGEATKAPGVTPRLRDGDVVRRASAPHLHLSMLRSDRFIAAGDGQELFRFCLGTRFITVGDGPVRLGRCRDTDMSDTAEAIAETIAAGVGLILIPTSRIGADWFLQAKLTLQAPGLSGRFCHGSDCTADILTTFNLT